MEANIGVVTVKKTSFLTHVFNIEMRKLCLLKMVRESNTKGEGV